MANATQKLRSLLSVDRALGRRRRPPAPPAVEVAQLQRELASFPARHLAELPLAVSFKVEAAGIPVEIEMMTARLALGDEPVQGVLFDADELSALVLAVEHERVRPGDFKGFCLRKLQDPGFRLTAELALDGAFAAEPSAAPGGAWSLERVLHAIEVRLVAARMLSDAVGPVHRGPCDHPTEVAA